MRQTRAALLCVSWFLLVFAGPLAAQPGIPMGAEFRVDTYTTDSQRFPRVASDSAGNFVVVWESATQDGSGAGVFGQRYASSGALAGAEFQVNTFTTNIQRNPSAASYSSGNFVVVWNSFTQDGDSWGVFGQRYAGSGAPAGAEFRVNSYTTGDQYSPAVASDASGNFVVVWTGLNGTAIFGQRYASSGAPVGGEFQANSFTTNSHRSASVASDSSGNFVVVWQSYGQDGDSWGVFGQRYASSGAPTGAEFRVNTFTPFDQQAPSVASDASGNFVVVWQSYPQDGSRTGVFGQRYASSGAPAGAEFRVNTFTPFYQQNPRVAADPSGNFVVVWEGNGYGAGSWGVFGQRYAGSGAPAGSEFRVNSFTTDTQRYPSVASDGSGNFVVAWQSNGVQPGASGYDIFAQRFGKILPVELIRFTVE